MNKKFKEQTRFKININNMTKENFNKMNNR